MEFEDFKALVKKFVEARLEELDYSYEGTHRQDDEYTMKAIAWHNAVRELYDQITSVIEATDDKRYKEYFSKEHIVDLMQQCQEEKSITK